MINTENQFNIAVATEDGVTVNFHLGRTKYFDVFTVENKVITNRERRRNPGASGVSDRPSSGSPDGQAVNSPHLSLPETLSDCRMVISRGMGKNAWRILTEMGCQPVLTDIRLLEVAVQQAINGTIVHHHQRIH